MNTDIRRLLLIPGILCCFFLNIITGCKDTSAEKAETFKEFRKSYKLSPVRSYTLLGTENSTHQIWTGNNKQYNKPTVDPDGIIVNWFNPGEYVPWVKEAMITGSYEFGLVDNFLPAVHYIYKKTGSDITCEMVGFAADGTVPGEVKVLVSLTEKTGTKVNSNLFLQLPDSSLIDRAEFETALKGLRDRWTMFFAQGTQIPCNDPDVMNACKASIIKALITFTGKRPHYGVRSYGPGEVYEIEYGDGFPPTIISLVDCLLDWGQVAVACEYFGAYFDNFITDDGRIRYFGPSLSEYGQLLWLARKCVDAGGSEEWFNHIRPKIEQIRKWIWEEQTAAQGGLIAGVPEADKRKDVGIYFHNNGWLWRGLRDISLLLGHNEESERCESFRKTILTAIDDFTDRSVSPPFIPPMPQKMTPFKTMTQDDFASYTNYRYWPELLSCGILSFEQMEAIIGYRETHFGEVEGLTRIWGHADNWPMAEYAAGLRKLGKKEEIRNILYCHLAGHMTPETWTAYEQVAIEGLPYREIKADYCVPVQLVAPRLAAWLWRNDAHAGWEKYLGNPVLPATRTGRLGGTVNDPFVLKEGDTFRMWHTWWNGDPMIGLSLVESTDGIHWTSPQIVLPPSDTNKWEEVVDRARLVKRDSIYHMWYTGSIYATRFCIGYATSTDGRTWKRMSDKPVMEPTEEWEGQCLMCPSVIWDEKQMLYKMWYSGGGFEGGELEPNAIGYATSPDGLNWTKYSGNPVLRPDPDAECEKYKVAGGQIISHGGWYLIFYIGFSDTWHGQTCLARSRDGIQWERHPQNPILSPTPGGFDSRSVYTPAVLFDGRKWLLWYNGASTWPESIGLAIHEGEDLGFEVKSSK